MKGFISSKQILSEYVNSPEIQTEFGNLYMYLIYVSGGDFSSFDDTELIDDALVTASLRETMLESLRLNFEEQDKKNAQN